MCVLVYMHVCQIEKERDRDKEHKKDEKREESVFVTVVSCFI